MAAVKYADLSYLGHSLICGNNSKAYRPDKASVLQIEG